MSAGGLLMRAGARANWSPDVLSRSVLKAWWCADDHGTANMTDDGSGLISSWKDRIGGLAVTAATTARPTWASNALNSMAGVTGDGVANAMTTTTLTSLPTGAVGGEIWLCFNGVSVSGATQHFFKYGGSAAGVDRSVYSSSAGILTAYDGSTSCASGVSPLGNHIAGAAWSGTTLTGRVDGVAFSGSPATIATLNTGTTRLRMFSANAAGASLFSNIVLRHAFITTTLSAADRQRLEGWIAWDSGLTSLLPSSHPYKAVRP